MLVQCIWCDGVTVCRCDGVTVCCYIQEAQLNEVLSASNLDPSALTMVTRKLEVCVCSSSTHDLHALPLIHALCVFTALTQTLTGCAGL